MPPVEYRLDVDPDLFRRLADRDALHHQQKIFLELFQLLYAVDGGAGQVVESLPAGLALVAPATLVGAMAVYVRCPAMGTTDGPVVADFPAGALQVRNVELPMQKRGQFGLLVTVQFVQYFM